MTNKHAKHKPRLNMYLKKKHTWPNRAVWTGPGSCAHGKLLMYSVNARDHFNCSPLLFSWPAAQNRCGQTEGGCSRQITYTSDRIIHKCSLCRHATDINWKVNTNEGKTVAHQLNSIQHAKVHNTHSLALSTFKRWLGICSGPEYVWM